MMGRKSARCEVGVNEQVRGQRRGTKKMQVQDPRRSGSRSRPGWRHTNVQIKYQRHFHFHLIDSLSPRDAGTAIKTSVCLIIQCEFIIGKTAKKHPQ